MSDEGTFCKGGLASLTVGRRYIYISLLGYAALRDPPLLLNAAVRDGRPEAASNRELADWSGVSPSTMHSTLKVLDTEGIVTRDNRTKDGCLRCSAPESMIRLPNLSHAEDSAAEHHIPDSAPEHPHAGGQGRVEEEPTLFPEEEVEDSAAEHHIPPTPDKESLSRESLSRLSRKSAVVTSKDKKEVLEEALEEARAELESQDQRRVEQFAIYWAEENSTAEDPDDREPTLYRRVWAYDKLLGLLDDNALEAWRHGMDVVLEKPIPNVRYAMKVMQGYEPGGETIYDQPSEKKPERYNPTDETIVGWENLEGEG